MEVLRAGAWNLLLGSIQEASREVYSTGGIDSWRAFTCNYGLSCCPDNESIAVFLFWLRCQAGQAPGEGMRASTIETYLSHVAHLCTVNTWDTQWRNTNRVKAMMRTMKREDATKAALTRRPVTVTLLREMAEYVKWEDKEQRRVWLAALIGTLGLLRLGEMLQNGLEFADMKKVKKEGRDWLEIRLGKSKTDREHKGVIVPILLERKNVPPELEVEAHWKLAEREERGIGKVFEGISKEKLVGQVRAWAREADKKRGRTVKELIHGHSFRKGGAVSLALRGVEVEGIKVLGRWKSDAFKTYVDDPRVRRMREKAGARMIQTQDGEEEKEGSDGVKAWATTLRELEIEDYGDEEDEVKG